VWKTIVKLFISVSLICRPFDTKLNSVWNIYRARLEGLLAGGSACGAGAGAAELLSVASPVQPKNGSDSSYRCSEAAAVATCGAGAGAGALLNAPIVWKTIAWK
jgi:hypothetical protein